VFIALVADHIHWHTVSAIHSGSAQAVIGALVFVMTGFGLGWVNVAADYSRYLPRRSSGSGVVWWTTFASSIAPRDYAEPELFTPTGRYGDVRWLPVLTAVVATAIGWGLVTNSSASWLTWQGYLLGPFGLGGKTGAWAFANLGVLVALAIGFIVTFAFGRATVHAEEAAPLPVTAPA
jgi:hypothetical protein